MGKLVRLWRWLEPGLIYLEPAIAIGYWEISDSIAVQPAQEIPADPGERRRVAQLRNGVPAVLAPRP